MNRQRGADALTAERRIDGDTSKVETARSVDCLVEQGDLPNPITELPRKAANNQRAG